MINAKTELFALFGNPIKHSLSPIFQNHLFEKNDLNGVYLAFDFENSTNITKSIIDFKIKGANITLPFKEKLIKQMDYVSEDVKKLGALNTIVNIDSKLYGYNTDVEGFKILIDYYKIKLQDRNIKILGFGGATLAILQFFESIGITKIQIFNRSLEKFEKLNNIFLNNNYIKSSLYDFCFEENDLIINTTSLGHNGDEIPSILYPRMYYKGVQFIDINYNPAITPLMKIFLNEDIQSFNGLPMLIGQGIVSFELWTGIKNDFKSTYEYVINFLGW
jgi:shikimate dehydrogenase